MFKFPRHRQSWSLRGERKEKGRKRIDPIGTMRNQTSSSSSSSATSYHFELSEWLTFGAIFTAPSGQTDFISAGLRTGVVAKFVVARSAQIGATVAVIMFVAFDAVAVIQRV